MDQADRLKELEDREAIRQVFVDYARYLDGADYGGYAGLFAQNGAFGDAVGPAAIAERMAGYGEMVDKAKAEGRFTTAIHLLSNFDIRVEGDRASAVVIWSYVAIDPDDAPVLLQMGRYTDDLVREEGAWKIASHRISRIMGRAQLEQPKPSRMDALQERVSALEESLSALQRRL